MYISKNFLRAQPGVWPFAWFRFFRRKKRNPMFYFLFEKIKHSALVASTRATRKKIFWYVHIKKFFKVADRSLDLRVIPLFSKKKAESDVLFSLRENKTFSPCGGASKKTIRKYGFFLRRSPGRRASRAPETRRKKPNLRLVFSSGE